MRARGTCARSKRRARTLRPPRASYARWELFAEELRLAQVALGAISGEVSADELLGEIFARFCVGK